MPTMSEKMNLGNRKTFNVPGLSDLQHGLLANHNA